MVNKIKHCPANGSVLLVEVASCAKVGLLQYKYSSKKKTCFLFRVCNMLKSYKYD